jgi:hypothetical protein
VPAPAEALAARQAPEKFSISLEQAAEGFREQLKGAAFLIDPKQMDELNRQLQEMQEHRLDHLV